jgi:PAS domain S-box-containing protein
MSQHTEQLVGALFNVLEAQGHTEARQLLLETYRSHAATDREELIDELVADLVTLLHEHLSPQQEVDVLTTTVEYLVNRFVSVIEVAPVAVFTIDESGSVQLWNDGAERIFGWRESEVLGESFFQLFRDSSGAFEPSLSKFENGQRLTGIKARCLHKDRSLLDVRVWAAPLYNRDDAFTGATFVVTDISAQKQREQRLSVLNRVLRHNIRNDVTVLRGHLDMLAETVPDDNEHVVAMERRLDCVVDLSETARRIEQLQPTESETDRTRFELNSVVENQLQRLRLDWPEAEISAALPDSASVVAHELLPYALDNLLENAVEHNDSDPPCVGIEVSKDVRDTSDRVRLTIEDNGPGLPPVEQNVLTAETETQLSHSTGLGLWLSRWIVRSSGGRFRVDSDSSDGTRIEIVLRPPASSAR